ncbi:MAG: putative toxin-antitoxin system toxin component, PIN family [Mucilaginibacter sp.]|uniref:putative toxin-antitoxin system toxin component, PIN family n=1 Tax=Mucilaginibacter sp. TaxID=1882438 RepID=UPI0034E5BBDF
MLAVIDTNVLLVSVSGRSKFHWLYQAIIEKKINIAFSNEILTEYEEQFTSHWNAEVASNVIRSLIELSTARLTVAYFNLRLITNDEDDDKFVDCAFAANADYIVTNDRDFDVLKSIDFPYIEVVNIDEFKDLLIKEGIIK